MPFSVLLSVYYKEDPTYLQEALSSIEAQTLIPKEIVLVKDGPLTPALENVISHHSENADIGYVIVTLEKNAGLGKALNVGLEHCSCEWAARMDTDDIALPDRFEKQFSCLGENTAIDILGSWICEFDKDPALCNKERRVPLTHEDIVSFAKHRNPMNHMTVVFRKEAVFDVGGYLPMNGFEDYYLWMRMIQKGKCFANLPEVLVKARTGRDMIARRQGMKYAIDELTLEKAAYQIGFWSAWGVTRNLFTRFLPRLLPVFIVEKLYNLLRKF